MPMMSAATAMQDHAELLALASALRRTSAGSIDPNRAHALLAEFGSRIEEHRAEEARSLYDPLLAYAEERSAEFGEVLHGLLTKAGSDWTTYLDTWTPDRMAADWTLFGAQTRHVLDRGRARLCLENELLYPLALKLGLLRQH